MTIHQTTIRPAITAAEQRFIDLYASVADRLPGARSGDVRAWREASLDHFVALGMPHRRVEEWKYTDLRMLMPEVHPLAGFLPASVADVSVEAAIGKQLAHLDAYRLVFIDGVFRPDLSTTSGLAGASFTTLREGLEGKSAKEYVQLPVPEGDIVASLSAVFATDGAILSIPAKAQIEIPIHLIFIAGAGSPQLTALQNTVSIGEGAAASLIETFAAAGEAQGISQTRVIIGDDASLKHVRVNLAASAKHLSSVVASLGKRSRYEPLQVAIDTVLTRAQTNLRFEGEGARCHYDGAMMLRGHSHCDFTLVADHAAPGCESRELVKAAVDGRARGVFQGKVIVRRGAQKTDGKQMANALLLSDEAEFDSKPELEIFADDVVCGHGATAGQLDEDMLFYLRARGIPETQARALLIAAFLGEALGKIENEALRDALLEKADTWLAVGSEKLGEKS